MDGSTSKGDQKTSKGDQKTSKDGKDSDESALYFDFPKFEKTGSKFKLKKEDGYETLSPGIMYRDIKVGDGEGIKEKQKLSLHYNYYDKDAKLEESMNFEDSLDQLTDKFGPGLKEGIKDMKVNGKRRIIILSVNKKKGGDSKDKSGDAEPAPGVFDVELLGIRRTWNPFG